MSGFYLKIMLAGLRSKLNLLDLKSSRLFFRFLLFFGLFVFITAVIHDLTDRWIDVWRNFDEVETGIECAVQSISRGDDAVVGAFIIDEADFRSSNIAICAELILFVWLQTEGWTCYDSIPYSE